MNYQTLSKKPSRFLRYTGLGIVEFNKLAKEIEPLWQEAERIRLSRPNRKRAIGAGGKYHLASIEDKLLLLLVFYRLYPSEALLGELFNLDASNVCRLIQRMESVLAKKIDLPQLKRKREKKISTLTELLTLYPNLLEFIADATEQEIPRPKNKRKRKKYYSGKKKRHTLKTQILIEKKTGQILDISPSVAGSIHDYKLFQKTKLRERLPEKVVIHLDKGYDGIKKDFPDLKVILPKKANRGYKLTRTDKSLNKKLASARVKIEHQICQFKKFKVLSHIYRHNLGNYNLRFKLIAGLLNFRLQNNQTNYSFSLMRQAIPILQLV